MRNYIPCWDKIGISKDRYLELLYFCRQYPQWIHQASSMLGIRGKALDGMPHGVGVGDPVALAAERRERLMSKVAVVDRAADVLGGGWHAALILNVCYAVPYSKIQRDIMPTSHRAAFFRARKEFFLALDKLGTDGAQNT